MQRIIAGKRTTAEELAQTSNRAEQPRIWAANEPANGDPPDSSAGLARALMRFEADALGQKPASIVLADDSDAALAAALVATKLLIPVAATDAARRQSTTNGRLIAQLADAYTRSP